MDAAVLSLVPATVPARVASSAQDAITPPLRNSFRLERSWRDTVPFDGVVASRWRMPAPCDTAFERAGWGEGYTLAVHLSSTRMLFQHEREIVWSGFVAPGTMLVTQPGERATVRFHAPCDVLHVFLPMRQVRRLISGARGADAPQPIALGGSGLMRDAAIERLALLLADVQDGAVAFHRDYACAIREAIVARLLALQDDAGEARDTRAEVRRASLPDWRLRRALAYVDTHLAEPIGLRDLAASAGVTRMHFAAQFRLAMGLAPHEYLMRCRIERAKSLLLNADRAILDIALACGFRTHAHFGAVFKRMVGASPTGWRAQRLERGEAIS
ncbi:helix-turn-helix domain-containing protein [Paraburkholderia pallida]|uniref:AraC family transcriptional regulator n=1 Tax=Paraburkholderia pallida TaxID=2547399 RepID=A0A4P7D0C6_9BURK|nr:AraC family transcriptional regulator [Paraburkholderia pallida]QBR02099.1 AraC family transcriptional regulator [Paraburkholderia pallida]